jgi:SagB-type dehydrogenase family enzyme
MEKSGTKGPGKGIGERFQEETKYTPENVGGHTLDWDRMPRPYKDYPAPVKCTALPEPEAREANVWEVFYRRRSVREYEAERALPLEILSTLLFAAQGITAKQGSSYYRSTPSAGALYPVETYLFVRSVEGLDAGVHHFRPHRFDLEFILPGDIARALAAAALGQDLILDAQVTFIWTAIVERSTWKYRQRAYRYLYLDAGHIGQNLHLSACALGLGACAIGAFFDDQVNLLIGVDGTEETTIYMATAGWPAEGRR